MKKSLKWKVTDASTGQMGWQKSANIFEFKEDGKQLEIDLSKHNVSSIERAINPYGYTLLPVPARYYENIYVSYGALAGWIIAECIFEQSN